MLLDHAYSRFIKRLLYRLIERALHDEYEDEYMGYEEQGMSYEEWRQGRIQSMKGIELIGPIHHSSDISENDNEVEIPA